MKKEQIEQKAKEIANQWISPSDYNIARDAAIEMTCLVLSQIIKNKAIQFCEGGEYVFSQLKEGGKKKMTPKDFFDKVAAMRQAQRDYFKNRDKDTLIRSKMLEKEVDKEIERVNEIIKKQTKQ